MMVHIGGVCVIREGSKANLIQLSAIIFGESESGGLFMVAG